MHTRVRFAPSPTGYLHIGGARTALFNWLYARQLQGTLILRIEDTDVARSSTEMVDGILEGLRWLGLTWDEGPYYQSQRLDLYRSRAEELLENGFAYRCFCQESTGEKDYKKTGPVDPCRDLTEGEVLESVEAGREFAVKFRVPDNQQVVFEDGVFGTVKVDTEHLPDFVVLRSDGTPTYHLSVVADDLEMRITHVIRGADHLSNTTKHVLLFQSLGVTPPKFVHLPLILGPDKKRLSKRHGATSVMEYQKQGFVPEALRNYLALLGWSPGNDQEFFSEEELIERFSIERINKANAVFDVQKLEWMNGRFMSSLEAGALEGEVRRVLEENGLWRETWGGEDRTWFLDTINLLKKGARKLTDFVELGRSFFSDSFEYDDAAVAKYLGKSAEESEMLGSALEQLRAGYKNLDSFDLDGTESILREIVAERGLKAGKFIGSVRVAMTGKAHAPGIFEVLVLLGRDRVLVRLDRVVAYLSSRASFDDGG